MNDRTTAVPLVGPLLIVNPKAYLGGAETLALAKLTDEPSSRRSTLTCGSLRRRRATSS
jgi:hypothetical protein